MDRSQRQQVIQRARAMITRIDAEIAEDRRARVHMTDILIGLRDDKEKRERSQAAKQRAFKILNDNDVIKRARRRASIQHARNILGQ